MISGKLVRALGLGLGLTFAATHASYAQEAMGFYFGGSLGESQIDVDQDALDEETVFLFEDAGAIVLSGSSSIEDSDTAFSVFGGYRFSPYFAVEGGYQDLGTFSYRSNGTIAIIGLPGTFPASANIDIESSGFTVAGLGSIPLGQSFDLHGKLGLLFADTEFKVGAGVAGVSESFSDSASSQDFFYGVGAAFHFGGVWSVSLDYQLFKDVGDDEVTGEEDVDLLSLGVTYRL